MKSSGAVIVCSCTACTLNPLIVSQGFSYLKRLALKRYAEVLGLMEVRYSKVRLNPEFIYVFFNHPSHWTGVVLQLQHLIDNGRV
jgi:hypothetical protein